MGICRHDHQHDRSRAVPAVLGHLRVCRTGRGETLSERSSPGSRYNIGSNRDIEPYRPYLRGHLCTIFRSRCDSLLGGYLAIRETTEMVSFRLCYFGSPELDPTLHSGTLAPRRNTPLRSWHRNYTRNLECYEPRTFARQWQRDVQLSTVNVPVPTRLGIIPNSKF